MKSELLPDKTTMRKITILSVLTLLTIWYLTSFDKKETVVKQIKSNQEKTLSPKVTKSNVNPAKNPTPLSKRKPSSSPRPVFKKGIPKTSIISRFQQESSLDQYFEKETYRLNERTYRVSYDLTVSKNSSSLEEESILGIVSGHRIAKNSGHPRNGDHLFPPVILLRKSNAQLAIMTGKIVFSLNEGTEIDNIDLLEEGTIIERVDHLRVFFLRVNEQYPFMKYFEEFKEKNKEGLAFVEYEILEGNNVVK